MQDEAWRTIERLKGYYEVSNLGRVRRIAPGPGARVGKILRGAINDTGYHVINLRIGNKSVTRSIHRLVCEAFLGPCPARHEVNHKNFDRADNRIENLEWVTKSENAQHAVRAGRHVSLEQRPRGNRHWKAKLNEEDVKQIRAARKNNGEILSRIAKKYGMSVATIGKIVTRKAWSHVA